MLDRGLSGYSVGERSVLDRDVKGELASPSTTAQELDTSAPLAREVEYAVGDMSPESSTSSTVTDRGDTQLVVTSWGRLRRSA